MCLKQSFKIYEGKISDLQKKERQRERNKQIVIEDFNSLLSITDTCKPKTCKDIED